MTDVANVGVEGKDQTGTPGDKSGESQVSGTGSEPSRDALSHPVR